MDTVKLNPKQIQAVLNQLTEQPNGVNQLMEYTLNSMMLAERTAYLEAAKTGNKGNGFRSISGFGIGDSLSLQIPRDRLNQFKPWLLNIMKEQGDTLNELCFELYAKGLTTRDIEAITESIYGQKLSRSGISRVTASLSESMAAFRNRPLSDYYPIIYFDATFVKTKRDRVSSEAYYIALGVLPDMTREVIGIYNAPTEAACTWQEIFSDMKTRGLTSSSLIVTDNLTGLDSAIERHFDTPIQKCILHLKRNILRKVRNSDRAEVAAGLADVFNIEMEDDTKDALNNRAYEFYVKWSSRYTHLQIFSCADELSYYSTYLEFEPAIRNMIYTTNWIERLNKAFKRTLKIRNSMPSVDSVLTLLSKVSIDLNSSTYRHPVSRFTKSKLFD